MSSIVWKGENNAFIWTCGFVHKVSSRHSPWVHLSVSDPCRQLHENGLHRLWQVTLQLGNWRHTKSVLSSLPDRHIASQIAQIKIEAKAQVSAMVSAREILTSFGNGFEGVSKTWTVTLGSHTHLHLITWLHLVCMAKVQDTACEYKTWKYHTPPALQFHVELHKPCLVGKKLWIQRLQTRLCVWTARSAICQPDKNRRSS